MKKAAISIITCICMFIGMLSFSIPSYAASTQLYTFSDISYTASTKYHVTSYRGRQTSFIVDNANTAATIYSVSGSSTSGDFYIDLPVRFYQWNNNSSVFSSFDGLVINIVGFVPFLSWSDTYNVYLIDAFITSAQIVANTGQLSPIHLPSSESATNTVFDLSTTMRANNGNFTDSFVIRLYVHYTVGFGDTSAGNNSSTIVSASGNFRLGYKFSSLKVYGFDLPDKSYVDSINTNIQKETQKQTDTMTNGYDNSSMTNDNTRLNNQIAQYDQAQESATNTSVSNIDAAEFINPSSNTSVFAAMTFSSSFLQSLYNNLGDFGIVVMVSLSLCLGLMLVGWFKYRKGG